MTRLIVYGPMSFSDWPINIIAAMMGNEVMTSIFGDFQQAYLVTGSRSHEWIPAAFE